MKIRLCNIPSDGLNLDFELQAKDLTILLPEEDLLAESIDGQTHVEINAQKVHNNVSIKGAFTTKLHPDCDRCLENFELPVNRTMSVTCIPSQMLGDEDEGAYPYSGDTIDIADVVRSQLFLTLPMVFLCSANCQGLCPSCGQNLNRESCGCDKENPASDGSLLI